MVKKIPTPNNTALKFVLFVAANPDCSEEEMRQRYELLPETEQFRLQQACEPYVTTRIGRLVCDDDYQ